VGSLSARGIEELDSFYSRLTTGRNDDFFPFYHRIEEGRFPSFFLFCASSQKIGEEALFSLFWKARGFTSLSYPASFPQIMVDG